MATSFCVNCGDAFGGKGDLCADCVPIGDRETEPLPPARLSGRAPLPPPTSKDPRCPHCCTTLDWDCIQRYERRIEGAEVEVCYYCPACRAILEFAAFVDSPPRPPTASETRHRPKRTT